MPGLEVPAFLLEVCKLSQPTRVLEMSTDPNRCRLALTVNTAHVTAERIEEALSGGDVASIILYSDDVDSHAFETCCKACVPLIQNHDVAAIVADSTQSFGRSGADGILAVREKPQLADLLARFSPQNIVGCGNIKNRHGALQVGELKPDFVFFGKLGGDIRPEPHHKNVALAEWWSELVQISSVVMAGSDLASVIECAENGAEFVAVERAIFEYPQGAAAAVREANRLLDQHAPQFEEGE